MNYLKQADKALGAAIDRIVKIERVFIPDLFGINESNYRSANIFKSGSYNLGQNAGVSMPLFSLWLCSIDLSLEDIL
ncbi:hypothetical protein I5677_13175 [Mobilitalea sibirica]|uniref:Uncharacterized protein n=1 Tax=Mobilitalea sibirica TaxID=1462919 RepID=A0A8J7H3R3_9FIRM|nr:hypothetical protein [Mobilitalea sibirica]MBH1941848.1 hypothetical protein [Mobilitalea sibirica]